MGGLEGMPDGIGMLSIDMWKPKSLKSYCVPGPVTILLANMSDSVCPGLGDCAQSAEFGLFLLVTQHLTLEQSGAIQSSCREVHAIQQEGDVSATTAGCTPVHWCWKL